MRSTAAELDRLVLKYRLQAHYLQAGCFLVEADFLAACGAGPAGDADPRPPRPGVPARQRRTSPCPHPGSRLVWVEGCGHEAFHPAMVAAWRDALLPSADGAEGR
jgi:proline iminopeptidase